MMQNYSLISFHLKEVSISLKGLILYRSRFEMRIEFRFLEDFLKKI